MANFNRVILMGNLTRDPELRYLPSNTPVVSLSLAVNDRWKDKQTGEWRDHANFIDCEAFGKTAEFINQYFHKGKPILIEGKLRLDQWQDKEGNNRSKLKVVVENSQFVDTGRGGDGDGGGSSRGSQGGSGRQSYGGGGDSGNAGPGPSANEPPHQSIPEDDIPF